MVKKYSPLLFLFVLLYAGIFTGGVVNADIHVSELECKTADSVNRIFKSKRLNGEKIQQPFSSRTLNSLGKKGLVLADIIVFRNYYRYFFFCKEQTVYMVVTLTYLKEKKRLDELMQLGWELAAVVVLKDDLSRYYLRRSKNR